MASVDLTKFGKCTESKKKFFWPDSATKLKTNCTKKSYIGFETKSAQPQRNHSKYGDTQKFAERVVTSHCDNSEFQKKSKTQALAQLSLS